MTIQLDLSTQEAHLLALFLKRLDFSHFLACTDGYSEPGTGDTEQAYEILSIISKIEKSLGELP